MELDPAMVDHALMTTRAVRRRLDFERPVADEVLLDCIDVAEQAPTGGNIGSRRWIIVRDQWVKDRLAELYMQAGGDWVVERAEALVGTGHPNERMMQGAAHLARNLARCPALVIPTIVGVHDGSGRPGLFDSVIQAAWSFQVALRARGLGSTWTTMFLNKADEVADLLGIPDGVTQIALFPVAYTIGTEFSPTTRRHPAGDITFFDHYGRIVNGVPSHPARFEDGHGAMAEVDIRATPEDVWELVVDLDVGGRFSEEYQGGQWLDPDQEPTVGSAFLGHNKHPAIGEWTTTSYVTAWNPPYEFAWNVSDPANPGAQWRLTLETIPGGTRLMYFMILGPGPSGITPAIAARPDKESRILARRQDEHRANMQRVLEGIKETAESK